MKLRPARNLTPCLGLGMNCGLRRQREPITETQLFWRYTFANSWSARHASKVRAARLNLAKNVDTSQICTGTGAIWRMPDANGCGCHSDESGSLAAKAGGFLCMLMDSSIACRARREGR